MTKNGLGMEGLSKASEGSQEYPARSTREDFDVYTLDTEHLDLYYIRNHVTELVPQEVTLKSLEQQLNSQGWEEDSQTGSSPSKILNEYRRLSNDLSRVLEKHPEWADRISRIMEADYSHPILMYKGTIIDGLHRILHAILEGEESIQVHYLEALNSEAFVTEEMMQSFVQDMQ